MIRLYDCTTAPSPRRARIFLAEKGIEYENVQVDLRSGEQMGAEFRQINPRCMVPVLELEDGTRITENAGIAAWADAVKPEPPLLGATPGERGIVASWNARIEFDGLMGAMDMIRNAFEGMRGRALPGPHDYEQIPALAERGRARVMNFLADLNAHLEGREYIALDYFTVADISALVILDFIGWAKIQPAEDQVHLKAWRERVNARPSVKA